MQTQAVVFERPKKRSSPKKVPDQQIRTGDKKFDDLIKRSTTNIFHTKAVFPFDLFPDEMIIDEVKINIFHREFFGSERIHSIPLDDVFQIAVNTTPFLSTLKITDRRFSDEPLTISNLWTKEAVRARRIIQGLVISKQEKLDISQYDANTLAGYMEELGRGREAT
jgi:hypothetical protein